MSLTTSCITTRGSSVSDLNQQCTAMWGYEPTYLGSRPIVQTMTSIMTVRKKLLELIHRGNSPGIFDNFTATNWRESIDNVPTADPIFGNVGHIRNVKRYFICQANNMSDLLNGRTLEWYVKVRLSTSKTAKLLLS